MTAFTVHEGIVGVLARANIDTDLIIGIERLMLVPRKDLGHYAFEQQRYRADGKPDPAFPLNTARAVGASVLVTGANFGCGSSREAAVWALVGLGMRCIVAPSFGDIFRQNCSKNGVLAATVHADHARALADAASRGEEPYRLRVDLDACRLQGHDGLCLPFTLPDADRALLRTGRNEIAETLDLHQPAVDDALYNAMQHDPWLRIALPPLERVPGLFSPHPKRTP